MGRTQFLSIDSPTGAPSGVPTVSPTLHPRIYNIWFYNSTRGYGHPSEAPFMHCWVEIGFCLFILIHSYIINRKRKKYDSIRILIELGAASTALDAVAMLLSLYHPGDFLYYGIAYDLFCNGIFSATQQLADNLIFLYAYMAIRRTGESNHYMTPVNGTVTGLYIGIILIGPNLFQFTLMPLIFDVNTDDYNNKIGNNLFLYSTIGYVLFNFYFSMIFVNILYRIYFKRSTYYRYFPRVAAELSWKCVLHCVISSVAILQWYCFDGNTAVDVPGGFIYSMLVVGGMHFIFNVTRIRSKRVKKFLYGTDRGVGGQQSVFASVMSSSPKFLRRISLSTYFKGNKIDPALAGSAEEG